MSNPKRTFLAITAILMMTGCHESRGPAQEASSSATPVPENTLRTGTLGPLTYNFDQEKLILADVTLSLPPLYKTSVFASKLIPASLAAQLGQKVCHYNQSKAATTCNASQEVGLSLALLERPISEYRAAFTKDGIGADRLPEARIDNAHGFSFTVGAQGSGTEYRFFPVDQRTLLIARQFAPGEEQGDNAMRAVVASIAHAMTAGNY